MRASCTRFSFSPGLLPYRVAPRIRTCPSLGSPRTGTLLLPQSPLSALHIPTSTRTWTTSALCTAAHPSPWSPQPGGWVPQMVSLRPTHFASVHHATFSSCLPWDMVLSSFAYWVVSHIPDTRLSALSSCFHANVETPPSEWGYYLHFQVKIAMCRGAK